MTIRELIELLEGYDGDKVVMMEQNGGEYVSDLENMEVRDGVNTVWLLD